jgi:DNA helicase-2/ATP-dependent DNA helicase PcrA
LSKQVSAALTFYQPLLEEQYDNHAQRLSDLEQLEQLAATFPDRATMLADLTVDPPTTAAELPDEPHDEDALILSTIHSAKGLEWPVVYILHASDGKIPLDRAAADPEQLEEERRLFYVALTRDADWLYVCYPQRDSQQTYTRTWESNFTGKLPLTRTSTNQPNNQPQKAAFFEPPPVPEQPEATTAAAISNACPKEQAKRRPKAARGTRR